MDGHSVHNFSLIKATFCDPSLMLRFSCGARDKSSLFKSISILMNETCNVAVLD